MVNCQPNWMSQVYHRLRARVDGYVPRICLLCRGGVTGAIGVCSPCLDLLPYHQGGCVICASRLTVSTQTRCGMCQQWPPPYERVFALFDYQSPITQLIHNMKYHADLASLRVMAEVLAKAFNPDQLRAPFRSGCALIPVPLHRRRVRQRGFNQSLELAKFLSNRWQLPYDAGACSRVKNSMSQTGLSASQRRKNVQNVFRVQRLLPPHVIIVDDVMTTGATVRALSAVLKSSGVERVSVVVIARAD